MPDSSVAYIVFDYTTGNLLDSFDTSAEAEAHIVEVRPYGLYGPDGHDLKVVRIDAKTGKIIEARA